MRGECTTCSAISNNPPGSERDAASIAAVMRMRQGKHARMGQFHLAHSLFVTENPRVAECGARFAVIRKLIRSKLKCHPPLRTAILRAWLWVLFGGKANELTEYKLLASCMALEARNDVSQKVHQFLNKIGYCKSGSLSRFDDNGTIKPAPHAADPWRLFLD